MLVSLTQKEFSRLAIMKESYDDSRIHQMHVVAAAVSFHWVSVLSHGELMVLLSVMGRTLTVGRTAVRLGLREFTTKSTDFPDSTPLKYSLVSIRRAIHALSERGLLTIYAPSIDDSGNESDGRMYEIDFKTASLGLKQDVKTGEMAAQPPLMGERPPSQRRESPYCINHRLGKPNKPLVASLRSRSNVEDSQAMSRNESIQSVLHRVKEVSAGNRATLVAKAAGPVADLNMKMLQAVIDKVMERDSPDLPRVMVTKVAFGVMKKRLGAYKITDLESFVTFSFSGWTTIATQNRMALVRDPSKAQKFKPMPLAPSFSDFAYRLPYFISAYANRKAAQGAAPEAQKVTTREQQLEREVRDLRRQQEASRGIIRRISAKRSITQTDAVPPSKMVKGEALDSDWVPPAW